MTDELVVLIAVLLALSVFWFGWIGPLFTARRRVDRILADVQPRNAFDQHVAEAFDVMDLELNDMPEQTGDDECNDTAADFLLWADEVAAERGIAKYVRRMERRSL